jgi:hypothetical protein
MERPEGDHDGGSIGGIAGIVGTLMKLGSIVFLVVLLEKDSISFAAAKQFPFGH